MTDLPAFGELAAADQGLVVFTTLRRDGSAQASVVNAGVLPHPLTNEPVVGLVAIGGARKLAHLRADPRTTVTARVRLALGHRRRNGPTDRARRPPPRRRRGPAAGDASRDLHRGRRNPRRLGHLRPGDARRTSHRRLDHAAPRLHQPVPGLALSSSLLRTLIRRSNGPRPDQRAAPSRSDASPGSFA